MLIMFSCSVLIPFSRHAEGFFSKRHFPENAGYNMHGGIETSTQIVFHEAYFIFVDKI